jgi:hypothetical protein
MKRVAIMLSLLVAVAPCSAQAQTTITTRQEKSEKTKSVVQQSTTASSSNNDQPKQVSIKLEEGNLITLRNRFGPIVVAGVGGDTLEASVACLKQGTADYKFKISTTRYGKEKIMIAVAVTPGVESAEKESRDKGVAQGKGGMGGVQGAVGVAAGKAPGAQAPQPSQPRTAQPGAQGGSDARTRTRPPKPETAETTAPNSLRGVGDLRLEVRLPRNAHIELIDSRRFAVITSGTPSYLTNTRNDVYVANIDSPISIISSGDIQVSKVGGLEARTRASNVSVKDVSGPINVSTVTGAVLVKDVDSDVRAVSISGPISIECAKGRVEATTTNGAITLMSIGGDVDATTTGGTIIFNGTIREGGRYRLKSISGIVHMFVQKEPPGFVASLSSYKGQILLGFDLKRELSSGGESSDLPPTQAQPIRRMTGRFGDGDTRIILDSFSGSVQLARASELKKCR